MLESRFIRFIIAVFIPCLLKQNFVDAAPMANVTCAPGHGRIYPLNITYNGKCEQEITTEHECRVAAENNQIASGDIDGYGGRRDGEHYPPGCYLYSRTYYFNRYPESKAGCNPWMPCVCKTDTCFPCSNSTYNDEYAVNAKCKRCFSGKYHFSSGATSSNACVNAPGSPKCGPGYVTDTARMDRLALALRKF